MERCDPVETRRADEVCRDILRHAFLISYTWRHTSWCRSSSFLRPSESSPPVLRTTSAPRSGRAADNPESTRKTTPPLRWGWTFSPRRERLARFLLTCISLGLGSQTKSKSTAFVKHHERHAQRLLGCCDPQLQGSMRNPPRLSSRRRHQALRIRACFRECSPHARGSWLSEEQLRSSPLAYSVCFRALVVTTASKSLSPATLKPAGSHRLCLSVGMLLLRQEGPRSNQGHGPGIRNHDDEKCHL